MDPSPGVIAAGRFRSTAPKRLPWSPCCSPIWSVVVSTSLEVGLVFNNRTFVSAQYNNRDGEIVFDYWSYKQIINIYESN
jgi:hypothetical protein